VHTAFAQEFDNWFLAAKAACSKWKRKKESCAAPHLLGFRGLNLSAQTRSTFKDMLAKALGIYKYIFEAYKTQYAMRNNKAALLCAPMGCQMQPVSYTSRMPVVCIACLA